MQRSTISNNSRNGILKRLKDSNEPAWGFDEELVHDDFNGFNNPALLLDTFLMRLEAVKGLGVVVDNKASFAGELKRLLNTCNQYKVYCSVPSLQNYLRHEGFELLDNEPSSGSKWVAITGCECLIALTGSVMASAGSGPGRKIHVSPEIHVVYAGLSQLVPFIIDGFNKAEVNGNPSWIGLITGPSRTADIEKTLVLGAHGPKSLLVFIDSSF